MRLKDLLQIGASFDMPNCNDAFLYLFIKAQPVVFGDLKKKQN